MDEGLSLGWTILIAIVSGGLAGGLLSFIATGKRINYEREENFRDRRVSAADEFSRALMRAAFVLEGTDRAICACSSRAEMPPHEPSESACDTAHNRLARVELLFGHDTPAGNAANEAIVKLREACAELAPAEPGTERKEGSPFAVAYDAAIESHERFTVAAHSLIRPPDASWLGLRSSDVTAQQQG